MLGKLFQRLSEAPTNPQVQAEAEEFDVADLYRGPVHVEEGPTQSLPLDEKLRQAYFWVVNHAIVSDNDMFSMLDSKSKGNSGWQVAERAVKHAGGGATFVLELPAHVRDPKWPQNTVGYLERIEQIGWNAAIVSSMEELVEFARRFARGRFGEG